MRRLASVLKVETAVIANAVKAPAPALLDPSKWTVPLMPDVLEAMRNWAGLSKEQLAARVGVHPHTITRWISDVSRPDASRLNRLEDALGLSRGTLILLGRTQSSNCTGV